LLCIEEKYGKRGEKSFCKWYKMGSQQGHSTLLLLFTAITAADITKCGVGYFMKFCYSTSAVLLSFKDRSHSTLLSRGHLQLSHYKNTFYEAVGVNPLVSLSGNKTKLN